MLDIRTLFALLALFCLVGGIGALGLTVPTERRPSLRRWALGGLLTAVGLLLLALRDTIPLWPSVVLGNGLLLGGLLLYYQAVCLLVKKPFQGRWQLAGSLLVLLAFHLMVALELEPRYRIEAAAVIMAAVLTGIALALRHLHSPAINRPRLLMVGLHLLAALGALVRAAHSAFSPDSATHLLQPTPVQTMTFLTLALALVGSNIAYLLMQSGLAYRDLELVASHDLLAGVHNRRRFMEIAERDWALAQRLGRPLSVMMLDLDHFRGINDEFGHLTGDEALRRVGQILQDAIREVDLVCRYSGEEFCVVMADTEPDAARRSAERIRRELAALELRVGGRQVPLSVSIGIAGLRSLDDHRTLSELLSAADEALFLAKVSGRNQVTVERL